LYHKSQTKKEREDIHESIIGVITFYIVLAFFGIWLLGGGGT
jgi:hypothetical protein